jgi:Flp pilus assembly protein TadB
MNTEMTTRTSAFRRIPARLPFPLHDPDLRVSDAERSDVADRLSRHYSDGRLTQDEFNERVDRAMSAKTQSDLCGLFDDLPSLDDQAEVPARRVHRRSRHTALFLVLVIVAVVSVGHAFWWFFMPPWLVVLLVAAVGIYVLTGREHRSHHSEDSERRP